MCAGITEAIFINPFEVVKVTLQSDKTHMKQLHSTWSVTKRILQTVVIQDLFGKTLKKIKSIKSIKILKIVGFWI